jgi:hypothetical protein
MFLSIYFGSIVCNIPGDATFVKRQEDIIHLFYHIYQPNGYEDQVKLGKGYSIEAHLAHYNVMCIKSPFYYKIIIKFNIVES